ncbi:GTPase IMAP family member GIMD1-like [Megalops cyprinoides]|uniref:GTPase IMAP family member GIMD1-like n=1 Tax=Megalops cyprinoides TaxID=118141 RepID=UPI001863DF6C|nr:GTPase IMAP family member GIMD1-like [Megalops cyprinoides]
MDPPEQGLLCLNVLLLGRPQAGKSATGNTLLGSYEFQSRLSPGAVTRECRLCWKNFPGFLRRQGVETALRLQVLDTPAYPNCLLSSERVKQDVATAAEKVFPEGVHMLVLVTRADVPICEDDHQLVHLAEELLGPGWRSHTLLVLSHSDRVSGARLKGEEYLRLASGAFQALLESVDHRYHFVDNSVAWPQAEGRPLLEKLLRISSQNKYSRLQIKPGHVNDLGKRQQERPTHNESIHLS